MSNAVPDIFAVALSLPESDRASLAYELLHSLKPPGVLSEDDPHFLDELQRRSDAYDRGESTASDWEEVDSRMRQALNARKPS